MTEKKDTPEDIEWAKSVIHPELPELDEKDHEIAKLRFVLNCLEEKVGNIYWKAGAYGHNPDYNSVEEVMTAMKNILFPDDDERFYFFPDGTEQQDIDTFAGRNNWERMKSNLYDGHMGDCTAFPATCMKCYVERFYGIDTHPPNKTTGSKALHILIRANEVNRK